MSHSYVYVTIEPHQLLCQKLLVLDFLKFISSKAKIPHNILEQGKIDTIMKKTT
jgi:hypothetical protein